MQFRTKIPIRKIEFPIDYTSKVMSFGSCFAENMSEKLDYYKFQNSVNPFGIIFNPISIEKLIQRSIEKEYFTEKDIFFHNEQWHCYEVHSELSNPNKEEFLIVLNQLIDSTNKQINESTHFIITLGTSWVYRNIKSSNIVANCHKVPQKEFTKELLTIETIGKSLQNSISLVRTLNPNCQFIFTVSPVRHIKDGFVENTLSKAHLISAIHSLIANYSNPITYFPSYEVMMDELRDYRFYTEDMLHPNQVAVDYIWERFSESHITVEAHSSMKDVAEIQKGLAHKSFNPESDGYLKFLKNLEQKIQTLQKQLPFVKFC